MKQTLYTILAIFFAAPALLFAQTAPAPSPIFSNPLRAGDIGENVQYLQQILKSDPNIYPQGLVTGTFGPLTFAAVKRLQAKYGLLQTGVVDAQTQAILFPTNTQILIISWKRF